MTRTLPSLAILSVCYLAGCTDQKAPGSEATAPQARVEPKAQAAFPAAQPAPKAALPDLSTTAPEQPRTILDKPAASPSSAQEMLDKVGPTPIAADEKTAGTAETKEEKLIDFDRELDPSEVHIDRFVLAKGMKGREPVDVTDVFPSDTKEIYAFVQFANEKGAPYALRVHWEKLDGPATPYGFKLEIPTATRWRTWSWTRIQREPGVYRAVLRTLKGDEVASREFEIEASDAF